jgi:hypothetical protein
MLLLPGKNNRLNHLAQTNSELSQVPIATCLMDRRNKILLTSQLYDETTSKLLSVKDSLYDQGKQGKTLQPSPPQAVFQEGQHPSPHDPEYQAPIPGLDATGISTELLQS